MEAYQNEVSQKFDIPLSHLDYAYIEKCKDGKELEKIVKCLRSGVEGRFPDLEKKAEERLAAIDPSSKVLRKAESVVTPDMLHKGERDQLMDELKSWSNEMKSMESRLNKPSGDQGELPPVRGSNTSIKLEKGPSGSDTSGSSNKNKNVKPRDFREWDKFDVDAELAKVDATELKETNGKKNDSLKGNKPSIQEELDKSALTSEEKSLKADREKDKGNEAFHSGDYAEALVYYNRSLCLQPSVAAQNNRAQAYIKLQKWDEAIQDCNSVLRNEPGNVKALLRRGVAHQGKKNYLNAKNDLQQVLAIEPTNKRAQEMITKVEQCMKEQKTKGRRMVIEEVDGSESEEETDTKEKGQDETPEIEVLKSEIPAKASQDESLLDGNVEETETCDPSSKPMLKPIEKPLESTDNTSTECGDSVLPQSLENKQTSSQSSEEIIHECDSDNDTVKQSAEAVSEMAPVSDGLPTKASTETSENDDPLKVINHTVESVKKDPSVEATPDNSPRLSTPPPPLPPDVVLLKIAGNDLFKVGQYGEALFKYTQAMDKLLRVKELHRENLSVLYSNRAACRSKTGDCEGCVRDCNAALELTPTAVKPFLRRAAAYEQMEKYRKAYVEYRQVLFQDSSLLAAHQGINRCSNMLQQLDGKSWRDKLPQTQLPGSPSTSTVQDESIVGQHDFPATSGPCEEDMEHMRVEKFEKYKTEGNSLVSKGRYQEAIDCYTTCLQLYPDRAVPYTNRALCYLKLKKPVRVVDDCTAALQLEENNVKALFRRSQAYKMLERPRESAEDLRNLLAIDSSNSLAQKELRVAEHAIRQRDTQEKRAAVAQKTAAAHAQRVRHRLNIQEVDASSSEDESSVKCKAQIGSDRVPPTHGSHHVPTNTHKHSGHHTSQKPNIPPHQHHASPTTNSTHKPSTHTAKTEKSSPTKIESKLQEASVQKPAKSRIKETAMDKDLVKDKDKSPSPNEKGQPTTQAPKLMKATPYEFIQAWTSLKSSKGPEAYAALMEQLEPEELPKVVGNKLDGDMLHKIICCAELLVDRGEASRAFAYLRNLTTVPRFQMATMFMSSQEKQDLERVIGKLLMFAECPQLQQDLRNLQKAYSL